MSDPASGRCSRPTRPQGSLTPRFPVSVSVSLSGAYRSGNACPAGRLFLDMLQFFLSVQNVLRDAHRKRSIVVTGARCDKPQRAS